MGDQADSIYDPSHRYRRCEQISQDGVKTIYRALDQQEGTVVRWNEIPFDGAPTSRFQQLLADIKTIGNFESPHVLKLLFAWVDRNQKLIIFITEFFTEQTIRSYTNTVVHDPPASVISNWVYQILEGLLDLHSLNPPFSHRDLRCDKIFIDPAEGIVKIGVPAFEFQLSETLPPIAAPEAQQRLIDPKSDVWSVGLCVVEMATQAIPYSELGTPAAQRKAVLDKIMPQALSQVSDPNVADFIATCLQPYDLRPTISQLMEHSLILDFRQVPDSGRDKSQPDSGRDKSQSNNNIDLRQSPQFLELLAKQKKEKEDLEMAQKQARHNLRVKLSTKKRSLRELLSSVSQN